MPVASGTNAHRYKLAGQEEMAVEEFVEQEGKTVLWWFPQAFLCAGT